VTDFHDVHISRTILDAYHQRLADRLESDVLVVGAGPSGLTAAADLAAVAVIQDAAVPLVEDAGVRHARRPDGLYAVDAIELASALCLKAVQAGAALLNLITAEDLCVRDGRVCGVVANRSMIAGALPVDPIALSARAVIDGTGHDAGGDLPRPLGDRDERVCRLRGSADGADLRRDAALRPPSRRTGRRGPSALKRSGPEARQAG